ncbi:hypothetical protein [Sphingobacterium haloxyli]|uniref:Lipoprotein n=1 Tax=Sphingobacterium haloxyli TaxID=2100533 RepID=A0A2S9ITE9_9SPHI|nr:hypothetical protein [Sphingobacterium haloxyli]PRD43781.1 hypothetical protein C5745_19745 [Sphingobacterium haloxyli]
MNFKIIIICFLACMVASCLSNGDSNKATEKKLELKLDLPELSYGDSLALNQVLSELDKNYNFRNLLNKSGINILYVRNLHDSVFFDFSIFYKEYLGIFLEETTKIKKKGFIRNKGYLLFVFDEIGLFDEKKIKETVDFGIQESEYPILYEPLLYRYYLEKKEGRLKFVEESWF